MYDFIIISLNTIVPCTIGVLMMLFAPVIIPITVVAGIVSFIGMLLIGVGLTPFAIGELWFE